MPRNKPRLHLDEDTSNKNLWNILTERGHDVTRTPTGWMPLKANDEYQLLGATAQGRCIFTFNIRDFILLAKRYPNHGGILLATQRNFTFLELVSCLDRGLTETDAADWPGQVRWLQDWLKR